MSHLTIVVLLLSFCLDPLPVLGATVAPHQPPSTGDDADPGGAKGTSQNQATDEDTPQSSADTPGDPADNDQDAARPVPVDPAPDAVRVPPGLLDGGSEWLNTSEPVDLASLRGKVVLVDFWTYCCINCIHVLPDLKYLEKKYASELVVIGVHSAKFDNEKVSANIRDAILRYEIRHPVVNDDQMVIWRKFGARSWPTLALIDPEGRYVGALPGEGNRDRLDAAISRLIEYHRWKGTLDETPVRFDLESARVQQTDLRYPGKIAADAASGRLFISDSNHNRIVVASLDGQVQQIIGAGTIGRQDGDFSTAQFDHPQGMVLIDNLLYIADTENHLLRVADLEAETVTTLAGTGQQGRPGEVDGRLRSTDLNSPWALCHIDGMLFVAMAGPHQIWSHQLGTDKIQVHAGTAREDVRNGRLALSAFAQPSGLTANGTGSLFYVADSEGSSIRRVSASPAGVVTTLAGASDLPRGETLFTFGDVDATGRLARFQHPLGVAWFEGSVFVADTYNHKIRRIDEDTGEVSTWLGDGQRGTKPGQFNEPSGLAIAGRQLFIADTNNHRIQVADLLTREIRELPLTGFPQQSRPPTRLPSLANAITADDIVAQPNTQIIVNVELNIPLGGKLNDEAPMGYQIFPLEGDDIFTRADINKADELVENDGIASLRIPLNGTTGTARIAIEVSFGYCETADTDVCKLATATWIMNVTAADDGTVESATLSFPARQSADNE